MRPNDAEDEGYQIINCLELNSISQYSDFYSNNVGGRSLSVFQTNIRSFNKNFDELIIYLNFFINKLDVIVLTECWLAEGGVGTGLEGFDLFQTDTHRNQNDGVIVYVNKLLSATATQVTLGDVYGLGLGFTFSEKEFHILAVYRTFDSNPDLFVTEVEKYFSNINKRKMCILLGDMNLDTTKSDNTIDKYLDCLIGGGFMQCIDKPTISSSNL